MPAASDLERIYDDHAQALFAFALDLTRSEADTRDLLQEMFRRLAVRPLRDANVRDARAFLLRMAHNLWVDQVRRHSTRERVRNTLATAAEPVFAPADDPDSESFRRELDAAFAELPPEQRAVVHLKLWEEMPSSRSAGRSIPVNTAASRTATVPNKLRAAVPLQKPMNPDEFEQRLRKGLSVRFRPSSADLLRSAARGRGTARAAHLSFIAWRMALRLALARPGGLGCPGRLLGCRRDPEPIGAAVRGRDGRARANARLALAYQAAVRGFNALQARRSGARSEASRGLAAAALVGNRPARKCIVNRPLHPKIPGNQIDSPNGLSARVFSW